MEVGCPGTWGLEVLTTQVIRAPQKPSLLATQPRAPPTIPSPSPSTSHAEPGAPVILLPLRPASLMRKNPQGHNNSWHVSVQDAKNDRSINRSMCDLNQQLYVFLIYILFNYLVNVTVQILL